MNSDRDSFRDSTFPEYLDNVETVFIRAANKLRLEYVYASVAKHVVHVESLIHRFWRDEYGRGVRW